jgi:hypothetical protein
MTNGSLKHDELTRSGSSSGTQGTPIAGRRSGQFIEHIPFVIADPRIRKFRTLLSQENVDLEALSKLTWNGATDEFRAASWRLLLGFSPPSSNRRGMVLTRKREEYRDLVNRYYIDLSTNELKPEWVATISSQESALIHQIRIDVPRTLPHNPLFSNSVIQRSLERILLMWALRHPASGYVQGINDLVTPFLVVFLRELLNSKASPTDPAADPSNQTPTSSTMEESVVSTVSHPQPSNPPKSPREDQDEETIGTPRSTGESSCDSEPSPREVKPKQFNRPAEDLKIDVTLVTSEEMAIIEADSYWAVSKFIDCIQDNYTASQPGIQRSLHRLAELVGKIDPPLSQHLQTQGVLFVQFAFRWVNCLLMRELPLSLVIRLWDTYIAEGDRFPTLHTYVCASFLIAFSKELVESDFQNLMMFLHHPPTDQWTTDTLEPLISQAFMWQTLYGDSSQHLRTNS